MTFLNHHSNLSMNAYGGWWALHNPSNLGIRWTPLPSFPVHFDFCMVPAFLSQ